MRVSDSSKLAQLSPTEGEGTLEGSLVDIPSDDDLFFLPEQHAMQPTEKWYRSSWSSPLSLPAGQSVSFQSSRTSQEFAAIALGCYDELGEFVKHNDEIVSDGVIGGLISEAQRAYEMGDQPNTVKLVHHALLLRRYKHLDISQRRQYFGRLDDVHDMWGERRALVDDIQTVYTGIQSLAPTPGHQAAFPAGGLLRYYSDELAKARIRKDVESFISYD